MMDDDECGAVDGMRIWQGKPKYSEKFCPVPLCPPQIPHDLTWLELGPPPWEVGD
jgi:hypothetical protein